MNERVTSITEKTGEQSQAAGGKARQPDQAGQPARSGRDVFVLHRTLGNQALQRLFKSGLIQAKLKIGAPNDMYEQEADRAADQVMRMPDPAIQRKPG